MNSHFLLQVLPSFQSLSLSRTLIFLCLTYIYTSPSPALTNMPSYPLYSAREALRQCLPEALTDMSFGSVIRSEEAVQRWLAHLLKNLAAPPAPTPPPAPSTDKSSSSSSVASLTPPLPPSSAQNPFAMQTNNTWSH